jgi:succinyl-CoA synthetase alpha subunit
MAILIDEKTRVIVQGITGRTGEFAARYMLEYGTKVVGGVTPGRGGLTVWGVPVYNSVEELKEVHGEVDASVILVPPQEVKKAAFEAINSNVKILQIPTEHVPIHDVLEVIAYARARGVRVIGPGSFGTISAGKAVLGWIGGSIENAREAFKPGPVGVISRSGGQTTTVSWSICRAGLGITTAVHVGAEPLLGTVEAELLEMFERDRETEAVALFGEIGGVQEEEAAELIRNGGFTKPIVAYIAGRFLPSGVRFSHASAIVERGRGSAESKIKALKDAGAYIADNPKDIAAILSRILRR